MIFVTTEVLATQGGIATRTYQSYRLRVLCGNLPINATESLLWSEIIHQILEKKTDPIKQNCTHVCKCVNKVRFIFSLILKPQEPNL